jgi:hypothetical protein
MKKLLPLLLGLMFLPTTGAFGLTLYFWDTNQDAPGAGGASPSGTWGVDAYWTESATGETTPTVAWDPGQVAVFAAGSDATGAYTITVFGQVQVGDVQVDRGEVTFEPDAGIGGSLMLVAQDGATSPRLLGVGSFDDNAVARFNVPLTDATGVVRYKVGTVIFGATNTFTGSLTIESGFTQCAVPYAFSSAPSLVLANLGMQRDDVAPEWENYGAVLQTGGLDEQFGTLQFAGTNSVNTRALDLGNGSGTLSFADSSAENWTEPTIYGFNYTLTIQNYALGSSKLRFGTNSAGLTTTQLSQIQFADFGNVAGVIDADGYVTPDVVVPVQPTITSVTHSGGSVEICWSAVNGQTYRVWSKDTLDAASWVFQSDVTASGDTACYTDPSPSATGRFYRVEFLLP